MAVQGKTVQLSSSAPTLLVSAVNRNQTHVVVKSSTSGNVGLGGSDVSSTSFELSAGETVQVVLERDEELWASAKATIFVSVLANNL